MKTESNTMMCWFVVFVCASLATGSLGHPHGWEETSPVPTIQGNVTDEQSALAWFSARNWMPNDRQASQMVDMGTLIRNFQMYAGLPVTGILDQRTMGKMNSPMCGNPDFGPEGYLIGPRSRRQFAPSDSVWQRDDLTWFLANTTDDMPIDVVRNEIAAAFQYWEDVTGLSFSEVETSEADIVIRFYGDRNHGDGIPFGDNILALAFYPGRSVGGDIHFNDIKLFKHGEDFDLRQVTVHEIGHSLGLGHTDDDNSIMYPYFTRGRVRASRSVLGVDDIREIRSLYNRVRLVGGSGSNEGRVEVFLDGQWGTVCDDYWDKNDGNVVCRQLGFPGVDSIQRNAHFGQGPDPIHMDDVDCTGSESSLLDCTFVGTSAENCNHHEDAGVTCTKDRVRLVGGSGSNEGRVEVFLDGQWGTVCDDYWDDNDGNVVCRQLGFPGVDSIQRNAHFGQGPDPIQMDDVDCTGSESSLLDCTFVGTSAENCNHYEDAGVICTQDRVRLVGSSGSNEGRVEVFLDGQWGTVCDDYWDENDGNVVCRQLGFPGVDSIQRYAHFGQGSDPIQMDDVDCTGSESSLLDCTFVGSSGENCNHYEDAGVTCTQDVPTDCMEVYQSGFTSSGVYSIKPTTWSGSSFRVYCNMTDGGGCTVFQRRIDGSVDFFLEWDDYKNGFGDVSHEHWLGNEQLYHLSNQKKYQIRIDLVDEEGNPYYAKYDSFRIDAEYDNYRLSEVGNYSGNAEADECGGDGKYTLKPHEGAEFSTKDRDNDGHDYSDIGLTSLGDPGSIARVSHGAWWYTRYCNGRCANLNGGYWGAFWMACIPRHVQYLAFSEMKLRPILVG